MKTFIDLIKSISDVLPITKVIKAGLVLVIFSLSSLTSLVYANTYTVTSNLINDPNGLSAAINSANNSAGADIIEFDASLIGATITLDGNDLDITDSLTIKGPVAGDMNSIIIDANNLSRHFDAYSTSSGTSVTLENLSLINGLLEGSGVSGDYEGGGVIRTESVDLTLNHVLLDNNHTTMSYADGGAIYARYASVTINNSLISNNSTVGDDSDGGGVYVRLGDLFINHSVLVGNSTSGAEASGGGINAYRSDIEINHTHIINNQTNGNLSSGGGLSVSSAPNDPKTLTINHSQINHNKKLGTISFGSGLRIGSDIPATINNSLIAYNTGGEAIYSLGSSSLTLNQTTVSKNTGHTSAGIRANIITLNQSTITENTIQSLSSGASGVYLSVTATPCALTLNNTILSANNNLNFANSNLTASSICSSLTVDATNSLFGDSSTEITGTNISNIFNNSPDLGPLQFNGGVTQTHKPISTSLAINAGDNTEAAAFSNDQRGSGFPRIIDATVDIGAVELQNVSGGSAITLNPNEVITRRDLARELLKAIEGDENYIPLDPNNNNEPYQVTGFYNDVDIRDINAVFIEEFQRRGYTEGCATDKYFCPNAIVTRAEMAKFFLKAYQNTAYNPPVAQGSSFPDVAYPGGFNIDWIHDLKGEGFTIGCGFHPTTNDSLFCPQSPVTREWFDALMSEI